MTICQHAMQWAHNIVVFSVSIQIGESLPNFKSASFIQNIRFSNTFENSIHLEIFRFIFYIIFLALKTFVKVLLLTNYVRLHTSRKFHKGFLILNFMHGVALRKRSSWYRISHHTYLRIKYACIMTYYLALLLSSYPCCRHRPFLKVYTSICACIVYLFSA